MPSADSCAAIRSPCGSLSSRLGNTAQASPGKLGRLPRTPAGSTNLALMDMDFAIRCPLVRPSLPHIRFLFVRSRFCSTLPSDTTSRGMPLRFANPSPPSGWIEDFHFPATEHAGHTTRSRETRAISDRGDKMVRTRLNIGCRYSTPVRKRPLHPTRGCSATSHLKGQRHRR